MRRPPALLLFLFVLVASGACERSIPGAPGLPDRSCELTNLVPVGTNRLLDILFVIDESPAMADEQAALTANLGALAEALGDIAGGLPDVHIAFVSADRARGGVFQAGNDCGLHEQRFLVDEPLFDGTRARNYEGELADVVTCLGSLGASGGATAAPLGALAAALDGSNAENAGFLREHAFLLVVIVSAQDDCSGPAAPANPFDCTTQGVRCAGQAPVQPGTYTDCVAASGPDVHDVDRYVDFLRTLKSDPNLVLGGIVAGPRTPFVVSEGPELASSCDEDSASTARPAVRLTDFATRLRADNRVDSMCGPDWTEVLAGLRPVAAPFGPPCLGPVDETDLQPNEPGLQLECSVSDVRYLGAEQLEERVVPRCAMLEDATPDPSGERPCWWVAHEPVVCSPPYSGGLSPRVERLGNPVSGVYEIWRCRAAGCD